MIDENPIEEFDASPERVLFRKRLPERV